MTTIKNNNIERPRMTVEQFDAILSYLRLNVKLFAEHYGVHPNRVTALRRNNCCMSDTMFRRIEASIKSHPEYINKPSVRQLIDEVLQESFNQFN